MLTVFFDSVSIALQILFGPRCPRHLATCLLWAVGHIIQGTYPLRIPQRPSCTWAAALGFICIWSSKYVFYTPFPIHFSSVSLRVRVPFAFLVAGIS